LGDLKENVRKCYGFEHWAQLKPMEPINLQAQVVSYQKRESLLRGGVSYKGVNSCEHVDFG